MHLNIDDQLSKIGINKYQLAKSIQLGNKATYNLCNGKTQRIYFETLERICKTLKCTPNDIFISDDTEINQLISKYSQKDDNSQHLIKRSDFNKFMNTPE